MFILVKINQYKILLNELGFVLCLLFMLPLVDKSENVLLKDLDGRRFGSGR